MVPFHIDMCMHTRIMHTAHLLNKQTDRKTGTVINASYNAVRLLNDHR